MHTLSFNNYKQPEMGHEGSVKLTLALVLVITAVLYDGASAQSSGCTMALVSLAPCLNYITGNSSTTPSSSCCSQLTSVIQSQPECLCSVLNGSGSSLGISVNQTLALSLPAACDVKTPPVSRCNGGSSSTGPATSPVISPADSSNPTTSISPSTGRARGSKAVPAIGGYTSDGNFVEKPPRLITIIAFVLLLCVIRFSN